MKTPSTLTATPETLPVTVRKPSVSPWRRLAFALWLAFALVTIVVYLQPVRSQSVRLELVAGAAVLWIGALVLIRYKALRVAGIVLPLLLAGMLLLPGQPVDTARLRSEYVQALLSYQGTPYIWGGETRRGIDCSGLIRAGLITAQWRQGFATHNPVLIRAAMSLAWHDASARAMRDGYRGQTRLLFYSQGIDKIDNRKLLPGDFAVTQGGVHTLAYVGNGHWIEAEPGDKVIVLKADADNGWLKMPVHVLRWRQFEREALTHEN